MSESPAANKSAFSCPHCNALAHQTWFDMYAWRITDRGGLPALWDPSKVNGLDPQEFGEDTVAFLSELAAGKVILNTGHDNKTTRALNNCFLSQCFSCKGLALWLHDTLISPLQSFDVQPNADMPESVKEPFDEARLIVAQSPRGAAALLRLSIQILCKELGESGKNINNDIAALVKKGLSVKIQRALDIVRLIGNDAVHPGEIDMTDNREVAEKLFTLVNLVCNEMISVPKSVDNLYESLPEGKRKGIEDRDSRGEPIVAKPS